MKKLLFAFLILSSFGFAQTTCVNCGGSTVYSSGGVTVNVIPKGDGASAIKDSAASEDGTNFFPGKIVLAPDGGYAFSGLTTMNITRSSNTMLVGASNMAISTASHYVTLRSDGWLAFSSNTNPDAVGDVNISRGAAGILDVGTTAAGGTGGTVNAATHQYRGLAQTYFVTGDFTTSGSGTALELITGLSWTFPATTAMNVKVDCYLNYNQNVAAVAVAFGFQDATVAPTNLAGWGKMGTNTTAFTAGTLAASTTTTATAVVSATPSAITTIWPAELHLFIEQPSNAGTSVFSIRVSTATAADTVTIKRGSYCTLQQ